MPEGERDKRNEAVTDWGSISIWRRSVEGSTIPVRQVQVVHHERGVHFDRCTSLHPNEVSILFPPHPLPRSKLILPSPEK